MKASDFRIGHRLGLAFALVVLMTLAMAGVALQKLVDIQANLEEVVKDNNVKIAYSHKMTEAVHVVARVMRTLVLLEDPADKQREQNKITEARIAYDRAREGLDKLSSSEADRAARARLDETRSQVRPLNNKVIELADAGHKDQAIALLMKEAGPATVRWLEALAQNVSLQEASNQRRYEEAVASYAAARNLLVGTAGAAVALGVLLGWLSTQSVTRPLRRACDAALRVAEGDLTVDVRAQGRDEAAQLLQALGTMQAKLTATVSHVRDNAEGVASASAQIAQGNHDLSQRTEEQAASLEQTAASMDELGSTIRHNADNASQANQLAQGASAVAARGGEVVSRVVNTMRGIEESSQKIADIIGVIDGIAFQTNILALNAAVEAARAGEQGRGFAVVAGEVRSLAQRSAEAAKEIKALITDSVQRVSEGSVLADQAGSTMSEVVSAIQRVTDLMGEISAATTEQSKGVSQVGEAVTQMDQATQQNAALVEESAAAAESLRQQAQRLVEAVSVFRLSQDAAVRPTVTATASATPAAGWEGTAEQRGPEYARNVVRPDFKQRSKVGAHSRTAGADSPVATAAARTGTDDWTAF